jgi:uncharacterized lipoprotein YehR (DUF1307 family)
VAKKEKEFAMKKFFKTSLIIVSIAFIFAFSGCQNAVTPQQVQKMAADINGLNDQLTAYQMAGVQIAQGLSDSSIVDPNIMVKVNQINAEADKVRAKIAVLTTALQSVQLTGDNNQDLVTLLSQLNAASSPFNPYAAPAAGVLALISLILTAIAKQKAAQAAANKAALTEVIKGAEDFKTKANTEAVTVFKAAQDSAQSASTKEMVGAIKATV